MKKYLIKICFIALLMPAIFVSCNKDLDRFPTNSLTSEKVYKDLAGYKEVLAKVYAAYGLTSSKGADFTDLAGIDVGTSDFLRLFWNHQELTTGEAICAWNDPGVPDFHNLSWSPDNLMVTGLYNRCFYQISLCNEFIRQSSDDNLSTRGIGGADADIIRQYKAEARFIRAFQYWVLMDLYANPPFVTEADPIGKYFPKQTTRAALFSYVESELLDLEGKMVAPHANEYGRADQSAAWALLARLYLNAGVYTGTDQYTEAIKYSRRVIDAGFTLHPTYRNLFLADNNLNNPEIILPITYDGTNGQTWGGMTFLINSSLNAALNPASFGVPGGGWGGNRSTKDLPDLFASGDTRAMFGGAKKEIDNPSEFTDGLAVLKFSNMTSTGQQGNSANNSWVSTDFPLFRLAEQYLIYAEAVLRGGSNGSKADAIEYFNKLRTRAYGGSTAANVSDITLNDIIDERGRELYWEGFRRTDLVRYDRLTSGTYLWPWKGGVKDGTGKDSKYNIFPLPSTDIIANPNLKQNNGY